MIFFRWLLFSLVFVIPSAHSTTREGLYLGFGAGFAFNHFKYNVHNVDTGVAINTNPDRGLFQGNVFLGYGYTLASCFYLGAEFGTTFPQERARLERPGVTLRDFKFINELSLREYLSFDILPGFRPSKNWLVYGRLGVSWAQLGIEQLEQVDAAVPYVQYYKPKGGVRFGAGINYSLTRCIGISLDYWFCSYQKIDWKWDLYSSQYSHRPDKQYIGLSLVFQFPGFY